MMYEGNQSLQSVVTKLLQSSVDKSDKTQLSALFCVYRIMMSGRKLSLQILEGAHWNYNCCSMRLLLLTALLAAISLTPLFADQVQFTNVVKASLKFGEESKRSGQYPHKLLIYLCLENRHDSDVMWICNYDVAVEGEVLDAKGKRAIQPPQVGGGYGGCEACKLGHGQRREVLIGGNASMSDFPDSPKTNMKELCAIVIGAQGWLIPRKSLSSYSVKVRVKGRPWTNDRNVISNREGDLVLFDVPPTPIVIK